MIHDIFEEQTSISRVVNRVMKRSLKLMKCEHCSVMLLNEPLVESEDGQFTDRNSEVKNIKISNVRTKLYLTQGPKSQQIRFDFHNKCRYLPLTYCI